MKKLVAILFVLLSVIVTVPAQARLRAGLKLGANVNAPTFETTSNYTTDNTYLANFTGGLAVEWMIGLGFGFDFGAIYKASGTEYRLGDNIIESIAGNIEDVTLKNVVHYVEVPVFLKYKLRIVDIEEIIAPYVFGGPSFAFKIGETIKFNDENLKDFIHIDNKSVDYAINVGVGIEIVEMFQLSAQYSWGLGTASEFSLKSVTESLAQAKSGSWYATLTWLF